MVNDISLPLVKTEDINMYVSKKRLKANRANAQKSTGPRTPLGKLRSSRNAVKHGFYDTFDLGRALLLLPPAHRTAFLSFLRKKTPSAAPEKKTADRNRKISMKKRQPHSRTAPEIKNIPDSAVPDMHTRKRSHPFSGGKTTRPHKTGRGSRKK